MYPAATRPLTRLAIHEEIEAGVKKGVAAALSAREALSPAPKVPKEPAALTACKAPDDLVRYFESLQQASDFNWCTSCCGSPPALVLEGSPPAVHPLYTHYTPAALSLLEDDQIPKHSIWDATQELRKLKDNVKRHFEGDKSVDMLCHLGHA